MYTFSNTLQAALNAKTPQRVLLEFTDYTPAVQFSNEDIMMSQGVQVNTVFNSETDLTIGQCPSAEIRFSLRNNESQLQDFEFGRFTAYLGARIDSGTPASGAKTATFTENGVSRLYEFAPLGVFIAERPNVVRTNTIDVTAHDLMTLFDVDMPDKTTLETYGLSYPTTISGLLRAMCNYLDVTVQAWTFLNANLSVASEPEMFSTSTMREVLGLIAEAACCTARFNRSGKLELVWFNTVNKTFDEHDYSEMTQYWYETKKIGKLHIRNADSTTEYTYTPPDCDGTNAYLIQDNPFLRQSDS